MSYQSDRTWGDRYIQKVKEVLGPLLLARNLDIATRVIDADGAP